MPAKQIATKGQGSTWVPQELPLVLWVCTTLKLQGCWAETLPGLFCLSFVSPTPLFHSAFKLQFSERAAIYLFTLTLKFVWINRLSFVPGCYYIYTLYCKSVGTKQGRLLNEDTSIFVHSKIKQARGTELNL